MLSAETRAGILSIVSTRRETLFAFQCPRALKKCETLEVVQLNKCANTPAQTDVLNSYQRNLSWLHQILSTKAMLVYAAANHWHLFFFLRKSAKGHKLSFIQSHHSSSLSILSSLSCLAVDLSSSFCVKHWGKWWGTPDPKYVCVICGCHKSTHKHADSHIPIRTRLPLHTPWSTVHWVDTITPNHTITHSKLLDAEWSHTHAINNY